MSVTVFDLTSQCINKYSGFFLVRSKVLLTWNSHELNVLKTYEDNKKRERVNHIWIIFLDDSECLLSNSTFACLFFNNHPLLFTVDLETACPAVLGASNTSICTVMPPRPTLCSSSCTCSASSTSSVVPTEIARSWSTTKTLPQVMIQSY